MPANTKRIVIWSSIGLAVAAVLVIAFSPSAVPVDLLTVARGEMQVTVDEEGQTRVHDVFALSAPVAGRVQRIVAHVGDTVEAGTTVLANIEPGDPTLLDPRSEAQAKAAVSAAESARALALAQVEQALAEVDYASAEYERARGLIASNTISQHDLDAAERAYRTRKAALSTAHASLQMRDFELEQSKAQLMSPIDTQSQHGECECIPISSPISGRVLKILNTSERVVAAGEPLLEIGDPTQLEIVVDFLSADAVSIETGQRVVIDRWGGEQVLQGRVQRIEPFGFTKTSALGIDEQRVNVIIDLTSEKAAWQRLGHGYQVDVRVVLWDSNDVLAVPLTALFRHRQDWAVFVAKNGRAELRSVVLGRRNVQVAQVVSGLETNEQIVLHPSNRVLAGVRIRARS